MSILALENPDLGFIAKQVLGKPCYFCDQPLTSPMIWWLGSSDIFLHPGCTIDFTMRLLRDVHEYEHKYHRRLVDKQGEQWP